MTTSFGKGLALRCLVAYVKNRTSANTPFCMTPVRLPAYREPCFNNQGSKEVSTFYSEQLFVAYVSKSSFYGTGRLSKHAFPSFA